MNIFYIYIYIYISHENYKIFINQMYFETRATLSVALYAQQMHLHGITFTTWKKLSISCKGYNVNL